MESLVSHEATVKEIESLCWDNRYREGMTAEHLAEELDALAEEFDHYEYHDNIQEDDNHIDDIINDLRNGKISGYMEFLQEVAEEDEDNSVVAEILMDYLKEYKKGC